MKKFVLLLLFLLLFIGFFHPITSITQDLGRHLITGEIISKTHLVPKTNLFSYTYPNFPFINHHWLSEVTYSILYGKIGFDGLLVLNTALILTSFGLIISAIHKRTNALALLFCALLYMPILFERTDVRPEFFSFLFLSLFIVILYKFREKFTFLIFLLPLIELFWVNMHIYFPIGIALISFFFLDYLFLTKFKINKQTALFGFVLILTILVTLINPNGLKGALYPLTVFQNYGYSIEENQNIFFLWSIFPRQSILFFFIAIPILFLSLITNFKRLRLVDWLISIFFTVLAALSVRNLPLFVLATLIPFVNSFSSIKLALPRHVKTAALILLLSFLVFESQQIIAKKGFGFGLETGAKNGADFFIKNNIKGPIFNNFDIGSYLDYRLYPQEKVFVDGRPEAYPKEFFQKEYIPMQEDPSVFKKRDEKYNFNTIFFSYTDQTPWAIIFLKQIANNNNWKIVYLDDYSIILVKNVSLNKDLIKKFEINQTNAQINNSYLKDFNSLIRLAVFYNRVGWVNQEKAIYENILAIKPNYCPVLYNLTNILITRQSPIANIYVNRFNLNCK